MTVTKLTIEIDDGEEPVVITAHPAENMSARIRDYIAVKAAADAEPRTMAADYQVAPPNTRLEQVMSGPDDRASHHHFLGSTVERYEWNAEHRQLSVEFTGGACIIFSFIPGEGRSRD